MEQHPITDRSAPLGRFRVLDTRSPDEAREVIGRIFCPHFLNPADARPHGFHARHHSAVQAGYSINFVAYGAAVEIDPGELSRFFLLQIPLSGSATVRCGTRTAEVEPGRRASVLSPTLETRMLWRDGCEKLIVLLRRDAVETQFRALVGRDAGPVEFATGIDLDAACGRSILRHASLMLQAAEDAPTPAPYQAMLRDGLATLLLTGLDHSRTALLARPAPAPAPAAVRRAEAYIEAHLGQVMAMADVAGAAGVCLRSLQEQFRQSRGVTLTEWIQTMRLEQFRAGLLAAEPEDSVADLAFAAGLGHLGRAAAAYRQRYGETPSETLRRHR